MAQIKKDFHCSNIEEYGTVISHLIYLLEKNHVIVFDGEMGAGKTTLIGLLCKEMGIEDSSSPTYSIVNTYFSEKYGEVYHFDFYRLKGEQEAVESGLDEMIDSGNLCFLEWADRISKLLPESYVKVGIKQKGDTRFVEITNV